MEQAGAPRRLIVGMTGATGAVLGVRLLHALRACEVETHLVISRGGARVLAEETELSLADLRRLATRTHPDNDQGAAPSSGSFLTQGMVIAPCSRRTLLAIACGQADTLVHRAADVVLKERRRLVLALTETPWTDTDLESMLKLSRMGAVLSPPLPAFYTHPQTMEEVVDHIVVRLLDLFDIHLDTTPRWRGLPPPAVAHR